MKVTIDFTTFPNIQTTNTTVQDAYESIKTMCNGQKSQKSRNVGEAFSMLVRVLISANQSTLAQQVVDYLKSLTDNNKKEKSYLLIYVSALVGSGSSIENAIPILEDRIISGEIEPFPSIVKLLNRAYSMKQRSLHILRKSSAAAAASSSSTTDPNSFTVKGSLHEFDKSLITSTIDNQKEIKQISVSKKKFLILYTDGSMISSNQEIKKTNISSISCGQEISMALTNNGTVISWGLVARQLAGSFVQISSGHSHCTAVDSKGRLFTWGVGAGGRLGHGLDDKMTHDPKLVDFFKDKIVTKTAAGRFHTAVLTQQGEVYTMGQNYRYQLGYDDIQIPMHNDQLRAAIDTYIPESSLKTDFKNLLNNELNSDLTIVFDQSSKVHVHLIMLARFNPALVPLFTKFKQIQTIDSDTFFEDIFKATHVGDDKSTIGTKVPLNQNNLLNFLGIAYGMEALPTNLLPFADIFRGEVLDHVNNNHSKRNLQVALSFPQTDFTTVDPFSDVHLFIVNATTGVRTTYYCHKIVLQSRSMGFNSLLSGENNKPAGTAILQIEIKPIYESVLVNFLKYLYYDSFKLDTKSTSGNDILRMISLCTEYRVERLKAGCEKLVIHSVDNNNVSPLLQFAVKNEANNLISYCVDYINLNKSTFTNEVVQQKFPANIQSHINAKRFYNVLQGGQYTPRQVDYFKQNSIFVADIEAGDKMSIAHDEDGNVYQMGIGSNHTKGYPIISKFSSDIFTAGTDKNKPRIDSIKAGSSHVAILLDNQQLYSWGAGFLGQVGDRNTFYPTPIKSENTNEIYNSISTGPYSTLSYNDNELKKIQQEEKLIESSSSSSSNEKVSKEEMEKFFESLKQPDSNKVLIELFTDNRKSSNMMDILSNKVETLSVTSSKLSDEESSSNITTRKLYVDAKILPEDAQKLISTSGPAAAVLRIYGYDYQALQTVIYFLYKGTVAVEGDIVIETIALATLLGATHLYYKLSGMVNQMMNAELAVSIHKAYLSNPATKQLVPPNIRCAVANFMKHHKSRCSKYL
ncbi:hypothetical protein DFA_00373 [Cavenderia fasciculata]|uniref:BTB domain-containing protein n=1 Tax=Cavenderia fasciculata TaxID=261658 RepID=F4PRG0_CACFS|nr:uncharacterized protein DFA_00373 [Cavenderia fasciculata]EGG20512.1 hypothetical protein DFA_00373 [Cavenderia fasciculata]|eukprot:XP_004358362.1 hypothetical protein DFA_00373 [Cavenderia fasciculata]